jgi:hypothetical protein
MAQESGFTTRTNQPRGGTLVSQVPPQFHYLKHPQGDPIIASHPFALGRRSLIQGASLVLRIKPLENMVFQWSGRYAEPSIAEWDGQYLVAGYKSGEVLILDFCNACLQ